MRTSFIKFRALLIVALLLLCQQSSALDLSSNLSSETLYSNNSGLTQTSKLDEVVQTTGLNLTVREDRKNFQTDVAVSLTSEKYLNSTYSDSASLTTGLGVLNFDIIESFLNWNTNFSRSEVLTDSAAEDTPDNRSLRNIFRTGPAINYAMSRYSTLGLFADYINVENANEDVSDSERLASGASYTFTYNPLTRFQLGSEYTSVLDADEGVEFEELSLSAGFTRIIVNGEVVFRYTLTEFGNENSRKEMANNFFFSLRRTQFFYHDLVLVYQQEVFDNVYGREVDVSAFTNKDEDKQTIPQNDIIQLDQASLDISRVMGSFNYVINGFWEKEGTLSFFGNSSGTKSEEVSTGGRVRLEFQYSPFVKYGVGVEYVIDDFKDRPEGKDTTSTYNFDSTYMMSEDLSLNTFVSYNHRSNNQDRSREYEEFSTGFGLVWRLF